MSTSKRNQLEEALSEIVQRVGNRTVIFTHAIASHIGLSATEFECLDFIRHQGPVPAGRLAELTGLTTGAITGLVDRLERAGFARRLSDPVDRRKVLVEAIRNDAASRQVVALYDPVNHGFHNVVKHYSDEELAVIIKYHEDSLAMIEGITDDMVTRRAQK